MRPSRPSGGAKSSTVEWASQKNRILQSTFYSQAIYLHLQLSSANEGKARGNKKYEEITTVDW